MTTGNLAGFPVVDVTCTLYDGSYHEVDSSALAFQIAARGAFREAMQKCGARLLEPVMKVCVRCAVCCAVCTCAGRLRHHQVAVGLQEKHVVLLEHHQEGILSCRGVQHDMLFLLQPPGARSRMHAVAGAPTSCSLYEHVWLSAPACCCCCCGQHTHSQTTPKTGGGHHT